MSERRRQRQRLGARALVVRPVFSSAFLACTAPLRRARSSPSMDRDVAASRNGAFLLLSFWHGGARHTDFWCVGRWRSSEIVAESGHRPSSPLSLSLTACRTHSNPVWREIRRAALGSCVDASSTSSTTTVASSGQQSTVETVKTTKMRDLPRLRRRNFRRRARSPPASRLHSAAAPSRSHAGRRFSRADAKTKEKIVFRLGKAGKVVRPTGASASCVRVSSAAHRFTVGRNPE